MDKGSQPLTDNAFWAGIAFLLFVIIVLFFFNAFMQRARTDEIKATIEKQCKP